MKRTEKNNINLLINSLVGILGFFAILYICIILDIKGIIDVASEKPKRIEQKVLTREDKVKAQFSGWDGSHIELTKLIKATMNDPKSYEFVSVEWIELSEHLYVYQIFRGKNVFGGVVVDEIRAEFDLDGNLIRVLQ